MWGLDTSITSQLKYRLLASHEPIANSRLILLRFNPLHLLSADCVHHSFLSRMTRAFWVKGVLQCRVG